MTDLEVLKGSMKEALESWLLNEAEFPDRYWDGAKWVSLIPVKNKIRAKLNILSNSFGNAIETYVLNRNLKAGVPLDLNEEETTASNRTGDLE